MAKVELKILKEFEELIDGYPHKIRARILKSKSRTDKLIYGRLSHYCKPRELASSVYRPSALTGHSITEVERELRNYIKGFTSIGVEINEDFDRLKY